LINYGGISLIYCGLPGDQFTTKKYIQEEVKQIYLDLHVLHKRRVSDVGLLEFTKDALDKNYDRRISLEELDNFDRKLMLPNSEWTQPYRPNRQTSGANSPLPPSKNHNRRAGTRVSNNYFARASRGRRTPYGSRR